MRWKKRANQDRSGPALGGASLLEGDGEAAENRESNDRFVFVFVLVTNVVLCVVLPAVRLVRAPEGETAEKT